MNLGGWLVPEPFIVPALFEPYLNAKIPARDEWTLSQNMAADTANGGLDQLENHYKTFIVRPPISPPLSSPNPSFRPRRISQRSQPQG